MSNRFVVINVKFRNNKLHQLYSVPMSQFTSWELSAQDAPYNTRLIEPSVGTKLNFNINGRVPASIQVVAVSGIAQGKLLQCAGYVGHDKVVHNFSTNLIHYQDGSLV